MASAQLRVRNLAKVCKVFLWSLLKQQRRSINVMGWSKKGNRLTQSKLQSAREGCRVQWVAIGRRSVGAWSAWCRVGAALHLADSSTEKVSAVWSAQLFKESHMHRDFQYSTPGPVVRLEAGTCFFSLWWWWWGSMLHPHWILSILLLYVPSHCNATQVVGVAKIKCLPACNVEISNRLFLGIHHDSQVSNHPGYALASVPTLCSTKI